MTITWEDRKNKGNIDDIDIFFKPRFSFEYTWFLVNDKGIGQYAETLTDANKDLPDEYKIEILEYYNDYIKNNNLYQLEYFSVEDAIQFKLNGLKAERNMEIAKEIDTIAVRDTEDLDNLKGALEYFDAINKNGFVEWTVKIPNYSLNILEETEVSLTKTDLQNIITTYVARKAELFSKYQTFRKQLSACKTVAEIREIESTLKF
jgi:hypothetical protein